MRAAANTVFHQNTELQGFSVGTEKQVDSTSLSNWKDLMLKGYQAATLADSAAKEEHRGSPHHGITVSVAKCLLCHTVVCPKTTHSHLLKNILHNVFWDDGNVLNLFFFFNLFIFG